MTRSIPLNRFVTLLALGLCACLIWTQPLRAQTAALPDHVVAAYGAPPTIPSGPLSTEAQEALADILGYSLNQSAWNPVDGDAFDALVAAGDPRSVWLLTDMMRFTWRPEFAAALARTSYSILDVERDGIDHWGRVTNHMIAWDMPAYPGYLADKRTIFTNYVPGWEQIFVEGDINWPLVSWGGVNIDDRPYDTTNDICHCIPAVDNPTVSSAEEATWLADDAVVFGLSINGEARAYPRRIMEIREMVNDTLGGRDLGIPYCTLCGAAQAYYTDMMPVGISRPVLRTSGLLIRSNKVMFDINTYSVFDTFLGHAVTGPLAERGIVLDQAPVITTTWGAWKAAHPHTTVLTEDLALGRDFDLRNTRDANGPIFPVGDVDPRMSVHEDVIGITTSAGTPVAFQRSTALAALQSGQDVGFEDVRLILDAGGLRAVSEDGSDLGSHQAFWFAWSQFHPDTQVWTAQ